MMLYIIATPIGNLQDITYRAIETLKSVDLIAAEDTRRTKILLDHYEIRKPMVSYNDHNFRSRTPHLLNMLKEGKNIAIVSDAGTPGISDPGCNLIRSSIENNIQVSPIPGACAAINALVSSGLATDKFTFFGFLPKKEKKKTGLFKSMTMTTIFYESPYRIMKTLGLLEKICPGCKIALCRELTKKFEEFLRGTPKEIIQKIGTRNLKGEMVLVIQP
jgi:16S rRNA (cytidine1402-2'-O)-methyltransferase